MSRPFPSDVEALEEHIDAACLKNPLLRKGRELALWNYLAFCEDVHLRNVSELSVDNPQLTSALTDNLTQCMKFPVRWIWQHCKPVGQFSTNHTDDYTAAWELHQLAEEYSSFETIFIYARAGRIKLSVVDDRLEYDGWAEDMRHEAYDRLLSCETYAPLSSMNPRLVRDRIANLVSVSGERFRYPLNPQLVQLAREALHPVESHVHELPHSWKMPKYTFGQFQEIASTLRAIAFVHFLARSIAAAKGCIGMGIRDSVFVIDQEVLSRRLKRYTRVSIETIDAIIFDLTFGNAGILSPDPAIQPLLPLTDQKIAICPSLLMSIDAERNFCVLCNRIPDMRQLYSTLSEDRSKLLSESIQNELGNGGFRFWSGSIPNHPELPDVDIAIICEREKLCFIVELKSFIEPAEPREIEDKSKEIAKGISQVKQLRMRYLEAPEDFRSRLSIGPEVACHFFVASANSIGAHHVQDSTVPVVKASHFVRRLLAEGALDTAQWLASGDYLPVLGRDFEVVRTEKLVDEKSLIWYGINPLIEKLYY